MGASRFSVISADEPLSLFDALSAVKSAEGITWAWTGNRMRTRKTQSASVWTDKLSIERWPSLFYQLEFEGL